MERGAVLGRGSDLKGNRSDECPATGGAFHVERIHCKCKGPGAEAAVFEEEEAIVTGPHKGERRNLRQGPH